MKTTVKYSLPGCDDDAVTKVAAGAAAGGCRGRLAAAGCGGWSAPRGATRSRGLPGPDGWRGRRGSPGRRSSTVGGVPSGPDPRSWRRSAGSYGGRATVRTNRLGRGAGRGRGGPNGGPSRNSRRTPGRHRGARGRYGRPRPWHDDRRLRGQFCSGCVPLRRSLFQQAYAESVRDVVALGCSGCSGTCPITSRQTPDPRGTAGPDQAGGR